MAKNTEIYYDEFSGEKIISTLRKNKFGGWLESYKPNQSILIHKKEIHMPSVKVGKEVGFFITLVCKTKGDNSKIYIEFLNYFKDDWTTPGDYRQDFTNTFFDLIIENETYSLNPVIIDDGISHFSRGGLINNEIFTREQKISYTITLEILEKICSADKIRIRLSNISQPVLINSNENLPNAHFLSEDGISKFKFLCFGFYNDLIGCEKYIDINEGYNNKRKYEVSKNKIAYLIIFLLFFIFLYYYWNYKPNSFISNENNLNKSLVNTKNITISISPIKFYGFEVMTEDLGDMNWDNANQACANLGDGWRLPTQEELCRIWENYRSIGGFSRGAYWSSSLHTTDLKPIVSDPIQVSFNDYTRSCASNYNSKNAICHVRAVKTIINQESISNSIINETYSDSLNKPIINYSPILNNSKEDHSEIIVPELKTRAEFPGGFTAYKSFLLANINQEIAAKNNAPMGIYEAEVSFVVDKDGSITDISIVKNPGYGTAEELVRVLKLSPFWTPASINGESVKYYHKLNLTFSVGKDN